MRSPKSRTRKRKRPLSGRKAKAGPARGVSSANVARRAAARQRKARRAPRKSQGQRQAVPGLAAGASHDARRVKKALDQLAKAQAKLSACGTDLLNVAHAIGRNAVAAFKQELVDTLVQDNLLQDLEQLRTALSASPLSADHRLLPEATLNWFCRHLNLSQYLHPGQELEVPANRLSQYDLEGPPPDATKALVQLQVVAPGWKCQGRVIIRPRVSLAARPPSELPSVEQGGTVAS